MSFWRNDTKVLSLIRQITPAQRFIFCFSLILLPAIVFLGAFYFPENNKLTALNKEVCELVCQKDKLNDLFQKRKNIETENQNVINYIKSEYAVGDSSDLVTKLIQKNNLSCSDIKPIKFKQKNMVYKRYFSVVVSGSFQECIDFFRDIKDNIKVIKICDLKICKWKNRKIKCELVFKYVSAEI